MQIDQRHLTDGTSNFEMNSHKRNVVYVCNYCVYETG